MSKTQPLMNQLRLTVVFLAGLLIHIPVVTVGQQAEVITIGERLTVHSKVLGEDRTVLVALPKGYGESEDRYPVLYVLDGEFFFYQALAAVKFLSECTYIKTHPIPEMITVGIVNVDRNRDFTPTHAPIQGSLTYPTSGGGTQFLEFLQMELVPLINERYRTQPYNILSGWSFGGLFTVQTYLDSPDAFSAYLAISPSLWWEQDLVVERAKAAVAAGKVGNKPLVVTIGALEGGDMDRSVRRGFIPLFEDDRPDVSAFTPIEIAEREHYYSPYEAFFDGLRALFKNWGLPQERLNGGLDSVQNFYQELSTRVGYTVKIPESAYQALVGSFISSGDEQAALEIARLAVDRYPNSSRAHRTLGVMFMRAGDDAAARARFQQAIEVEKQLSEPDSERIMDVRVMMWILDQRANAAESDND